MTTEPATKKCPFCAEEIKAEAIKCRFCGEMLDGSPPRAMAAAQPTYETRAFVIPFPEGSPPTQHVFDFKNDKPFPDDYLRAIGRPSKKTWDFLRRSYRGGVTLTWHAYKDYFLERINELGKEGWELTEPFEHPVDENGWLVRPNDRFEFEGAERQALFGPVKRTKFAGAKFIMRRVTLGGGSRQRTDGSAEATLAQETEIVQIPFPEGSVPRTVSIDKDSDVPFTKEYLRQFGYEHVKPWECEWEPGITLIWMAWRDYFRQQIDELEVKGWSLAEPFEERDEDGYLANAEDRFLFDEPDGGTSPGGDSRFVFSAAEFRMRKRVTAESRDAS